MQINFWTFYAILVIHFVADFLFQDEEWATNKSISNKALVKHVLTYTCFWIGIGLIIYLFKMFTFSLIRYPILGEQIIKFCVITFISHFVTDYFTSRIVKKMFINKQYGSSIPNIGAFTVIGFDQLLHYTQLFLTYQFLNFNL